MKTQKENKKKNKTAKLLSLLLAALMICSSLITGCSDTSSDAQSYSSYSSDSTDDNSESEAEVLSDQAGAVIYVGDYYLEIDSHTYLYEEVDYASATVTDFTSTGYVGYVLFDEYTEYYLIKDGELVAASIDNITEGSFIIETYNEDNLQQIIIVEEVSEAETEDENEATETVETAEIYVTEVTEITEENLLALTLYTLKEDAEYEITDIENVELSNFEATEETTEYEINSTDVIKAVSEGVSEEADSSEITVGDMLVIYYDEAEDCNVVYIYHSEN